MKKYQKLAQTITAWMNCYINSNKEWQDKHEETIKEIIDTLPHGSGIDGTTKLNYNECANDAKIVIDSSYHAMAENGFYDKWIDFKIVVKPSLQNEIITKITGNFGIYRDDKEYLEQLFHNDLTQEYTK